MKKASILLALALLVSLLCPVAMAATSGSCGTNITWKLNTTTKTLTITCNGEGTMNDYSSFDGAPWYSQRASIDHVVMTGYITYIGKYNFYAIDADFTLPDTVATIGASAFYKSTIQSINLPALLTKIRTSAFELSTFEQDVVIPDRVDTIGYRAFYGCRAPSVTLPASVRTIDMSAFTMLYGPTSLELPEGVTYLGTNAFYGCNSLTEITIPATLNSCGTSIFVACGALEAIHVAPDNPILCDIDGVLFDKGGTKLLQYPGGKQDEHYDVPSTVTELDDYSLSYSNRLESVSIPDGITVIPNYAFSYSPKLRHVDLPIGLTEIGVGAFSTCTALTELTIPYGVTTLGTAMFYKSSLQRITIPETVTNFGDRIFQLCPADLTLCVTVGSPAYDYAIENSLAVECVSPFGQADIVLPGDLTAIDDEAFMGTDAAIVYIPAGVTAIGSRAFAACPNLKHINLPDGASLADDAFDGCGAVYLYGASGGPAEAYAASHDNVTFVPLDP